MKYNKKPPEGGKEKTEWKMNYLKNLTLKEIEEMGHEAIQKGEKWKVRALIYLLIYRIGEK